MMRFETEFLVKCSPAEVIERFSDVPAMASLMPGASVGPANSDGSYPATLIVSFGPKRIAFNGVITNETDRARQRGVLLGRASAAMRAAKMAVKMTYTLREAETTGASTPVPASTLVTIVSEAELTGVLAEFAKAGGTMVTNAILDEFARGFSARYGGADPSPDTEVKAAELSAMALGRAMARNAVASLKHSIGKKGGGAESDPPK